MKNNIIIHKFNDEIIQTFFNFFTKYFSLFKNNSFAKLFEKKKKNANFFKNKLRIKNFKKNQDLLVKYKK